MTPGVDELKLKLRSLEEFARDCRSEGEYLNVPITREELGVLASYREFVEQNQVAPKK